MPFERPLLWGVAVVLAFMMAAVEAAPMKVAGVLLCAVATGVLYRIPSHDPATWSWHVREVPMFRRSWLWLIAKPRWMQRILAAAGPAAGVATLAFAPR